jgi:putative phage-type endonuclease
MQEVFAELSQNVVSTESIAQGSDEWLSARLGLVTASRVSDVVARTRSGWGASRANYMAQLIAERLTGTIQESFQTDAMKHGLATEPEARATYSFLMDTDVIEIGFVRHPTIKDSGASPDAMVENDGLLEIKCPSTSQHIDTLLGEPIKAAYICQMQWQMACTEREWCDFVSFDPRMPEHMRLFVQRVQRDDKQIAELEAAVCEFLAELDDKVARLRKLYPDMVAAA